VPNCWLASLNFVVSSPPWLDGPGEAPPAGAAEPETGTFAPVTVAAAATPAAVPEAAGSAVAVGPAAGLLEPVDDGELVLDDDEPAPALLGVEVHGPVLLLDELEPLDGEALLVVEERFVVELLSVAEERVFVLVEVDGLLVAVFVAAEFVVVVVVVGFALLEDVGVDVAWLVAAGVAVAVGVAACCCAFHVS
jgi:hypothetical protein